MLQSHRAPQAPLRAVFPGNFCCISSHIGLTERTWSLGAWLFRVFQIFPVGTEIFIGMSSEKTGTGSAFMNFIRLSSKNGSWAPRRPLCSTDGFKKQWSPRPNIASRRWAFPCCTNRLKNKPQTQYIFSPIQAETWMLIHKYSSLAGCKSLTYINSSSCSEIAFHFTATLNSPKIKNSPW